MFLVLYNLKVLAVLALLVFATLCLEPATYYHLAVQLVHLGSAGWGQVGQVSSVCPSRAAGGSGLLTVSFLGSYETGLLCVLGCVWVRSAPHVCPAGVSSLLCVLGCVWVWFGLCVFPAGWSGLLYVSVLQLGLVSFMYSSWAAGRSGLLCVSFLGCRWVRSTPCVCPAGSLF